MWRSIFALAITVRLSSALRCVQCSTVIDSKCQATPPPPSECPSGDEKYCLTASTFKIEDPKSIFDELAEKGAGAKEEEEEERTSERGELLFLVRTCVKEHSGDGCRKGKSTDGSASPVEFCGWHCNSDGCNASTKLETGALGTIAVATTVVLWVLAGD